MLAFLFTRLPLPPAERFVAPKLDAMRMIELLRMAKALIPGLADGTEEEAESLARKSAESSGARMDDLMTALRLAIASNRVSLPLIPSIRLLGAEESIARVDGALSLLLGV